MNRSIITIIDNSEGKPTVKIVPIESEVWMTKPEIARLLMIYQNTISNNLRAIFKAGILNEKDVVREHRYKKQGVECIAVYYSMEIIIALCYRICSFPAKNIRQYVQTQLYHRNNNNDELNTLHKLYLFSLN